MPDGRTFPTLEHGASRPCVDPDCGCRAIGSPRGRATILDEAERLTSSDRQRAYGHPKQNFAVIAGMWSHYLQVEVTPRQVAMCFALAKVARDRHAPKRDNLVDLAGYARTAEMLDEL